MTRQAHSRLSLEQQYQSPANLAARTALHSRFSINHRGWFPWVYDQLELPGECRILELGCGAGTLWQINHDRIPAGWRLVLTDTSEGMLAALRQNLDSLPQLESTATVDAQAVPYNDGSFDVVIANQMLYHVPDLDAAVSEVARVLRPDGTLYASTVGQTNMCEFHQMLASCRSNTSQYLEQHSIVERFSLENGGERISRWFAEVELRLYEDGLAVTEVEPLVAYAQSLPTGPEPALTGECLERFRTLVTEQIGCDGAFHIQKSSGMFVARKACTGQGGGADAHRREVSE